MPQKNSVNFVLPWDFYASIYGIFLYLNFDKHSNLETNIK